MTTTNWLHLDELRESWIFLSFGWKEVVDCSNSKSPRDDTRLRYWEIGVGNAGSLLETNAGRIDSEHIGSETALIESLVANLEQYRYEDSILILPHRRSIRKLRRRLVATSKGEAPSLRGFNLVILEEQLSQYFGQDLQDYNFDISSRSPPRCSETDPEQVVSTGSTQEFWELWRKVFRLIPATALTGDQL